VLVPNIANAVRRSIASGQAGLAQRYFKIVHPVKHRQKFRPWMKWVGVALPWIDGVLLGVPVITATTLFHRDATVCRALVVFVSPAAKKVGINFISRPTPRLLSFVLCLE